MNKLVGLLGVGPVVGGLRGYQPGSVPGRSMPGNWSLGGGGDWGTLQPPCWPEAWWSDWRSASVLWSANCQRVNIKSARLAGQM